MVRHKSQKPKDRKTLADRVFERYAFRSIGRNGERMSLANYVESMCNMELNNLAKNRWIDEFMQVKIYEQGYRVANSYLAENPMLCDSVKEMLWNDGTKRSYVLKAKLVINRHYENNISKYEELYSDHKKKFQSSYMGRWRLSSCFLRDAGLRAPVHIVDDITNWILDDKEINSSYYTLLATPL